MLEFVSIFAITLCEMSAKLSCPLRTVNYISVIPEKDGKAGLTVQEIMSNDNKGKVLDVENNNKVHYKHTLNFMTKDLEHMLKDPNHRMDVEGITDCEALSKQSMTTSGTVDMFVQDKNEAGQYLMIQSIPKETHI